MSLTVKPLSPSVAAFFAAACILCATTAQATLIDFNLSNFNGYINTPSYDSSTGTLTFRNINPRPNGSQAYQTGVGVTGMPSYAAGETLQWAILMRSTGPGSFLNIGVQSGSGDTNSLSVTNELFANGLGYTWVYSTARTVDLFKPNAYFWIPGTLGQQIDVRRILLGDPQSIVAAVPEGAPGLGLLLVIVASLVLLRRPLGARAS